MKRVRYTKYNGDLGLRDRSRRSAPGPLRLSCSTPASTIPTPSFRSSSSSLDDLREALRQALEDGDFFDDAIAAEDQ